MTVDLMHEFIQQATIGISNYFAPFMELPPDEYTFTFFLKRFLISTISRWWNKENMPWKVENHIEELIIKNRAFSRYNIIIYQKTDNGQQAWVFLKINLSPGKINLFKWDLNRINLRFNSNQAKYKIVGILVGNLPVCYLSLRFNKELFSINGRNYQEILKNNNFSEFEPNEEEKIKNIEIKEELYKNSDDNDRIDLLIKTA